MLKSMLRLSAALAICLSCQSIVESADDQANPAKDTNRLAYLDECNPWYPDKDFPKLITPQWVGEEGVDAVIVLAIDDMRDPAKYEQYLRPILNRLKEIDGRAPVSIMTCDVKPDDPQLQSWRGEGLSVECHTIDHPCPLFSGEFQKIKSTYDRCVDLMGQIPGNKPVAFRTPCCDSLNTVSPRFYSEIFNSTTENGNFLQIDSSVMHFFTSEDETLPKELVLDANGNERFWKYKVRNLKRGDTIHDNFVNYIKNYPYPYVINNTCWEIPCLAPSDWSAQHLHGINNPVTVEDWKAAIDLTVHKKGCFSLVFHPHGWIKPEQVVEMIDHAVAKHGKKVKFLNFREVEERLNDNLTQRPIIDSRVPGYAASFARLLDLNTDGFIDVVTTPVNQERDTKGFQNAVARIWTGRGWSQNPLPTSIAAGDSGWPSYTVFAAISGEKLPQIINPNAPTNQIPGWGGQLKWWSGEKNWSEVHPRFLAVDGSLLEPEPWLQKQSSFLDLDGEGDTELVILDQHRTLKVFASDGQDWRLTSIEKELHSYGQMNTQIKLMDINSDSMLDLLVSNSESAEIWLMESKDLGWSRNVFREEESDVAARRIKPFAVSLPQFTGIYLGPPPPLTANNGFFIHDRHFCWINEDTAHLPDLMYRVSFDEILAEHNKASGDSAAEQRQDVAPGVSPGKADPNAPKAKKGRQKNAEEPNPAAPSGLNADSQSQTPGSRPGLPAVVAPRLNRNYPAVHIGAAVVDITPDYPVRLTGYGNRTKESEGVAAKIHARALVIGGPNVAVTLRRDEPPGAPRDSISPDAKSQTPIRLNVAMADGNGNLKAHHSERDGYVVLITIDNCGVPIEITETVFQRIKAKHIIPREKFAISSTHSHSAPLLRGFAPNIFAEIPDDHAAHLAQYEKDLIEKLVDVADRAIEARRPGHLSHGFGETGFAINRRALTDGKWSGFGEVPDGPTDKRVPVLVAHDTDGKLIAVLANYACHCTTETGEFNQISGDWAGFAADMLEADHPGAVALIAIGCGADANPSPRGTHQQAKVHGRAMADEVNRLLRSEPTALAAGDVQNESQPAASAVGSLRAINPNITCNMARVDLPLGPLPSRADWEEQAKDLGVTGSRARYFLKLLDEGKEIPSTIPDYPVQTWCFSDDLAMVFLGGEVVVDYSIRMNEMFDGDRLWINAYSNDVPCYIASARVLREGGYECDSSMLHYRRPTRLAPEAEDVICDAVQKLIPHEFYSESLLEDFPAPRNPEESLKSMTTKPDLRVVLAASEPLIRDPVAFDWDERGRLWVVEMGDYPSGPNVAVTLRRDEPTTAPGDIGSPAAESPDYSDGNVALADGIESRKAQHAERDGYLGGRIQMLEDTDKDGVYDKATTFLDGLAFPNGIHCWRDGVIVTMAPEIFYAEDTDGDGKADVRETLYKGFVEGNQQHRVNGLRWGLDGWLYLANGDSGGEIAATGYIPGLSSFPLPRAGGEGTQLRSPISLRGRDLRIHPDTNGLDTVSGQTQFGRERDDFGNWFGNNNSNPIYQYVLEDRYVRRNPHAGISQVTAQVSVLPGAAPVYPTSRTLARFNDFGFANRFTSACSTMIYRDTYLGEQYYGNAFTSEPVHNLVSRLVLTRDGYGFKGERANDEQQSEFLASSDNWFRPTMIRTGPDGAIWVADMYRAVIEHPEWIPPEYQRKMNLSAGNDRGRIYRIVPAAECCGSNVAVTLRRDEPSTVPLDPIVPVAESQVADQGNVALAGEGENLKAHHAERDGYFDQPWNEIPIADLLKRLESNNGWWRDTAQRILTHRRRELYDKDWLREDWMNTSPQAKVQIANTFATVMNLGAQLQEINNLAVLLNARFLPMLDDADPRVRQAGIRLLEPLVQFPHGRGLLPKLGDDADAGVQLQLCLSLGSVARNENSKLLGKLLRENFADQFIRSAAITSLYATPPGFSSSNIEGVLNEALNVPAGEFNEELIGLLLGQAAAWGRSEAIVEPLTQLVKSVNGEASASRLELVAETVRKVLRSDAAPKLKLHKDFQAAVNEAGVAAMLVAQDVTADSIRRAAALRFADVAGKVDSASEEFELFLTPQTPTAVQLAAVQIIARNEIPASAQRLIASLNTFDPVVHCEVLTLLLQRESTTEIVLDAVANETLTESDFDASQLDGLLNHRNNDIASRAKSMLGGGENSTRAAVVDSFKSQISNLKSDAAVGKVVFEKRCSSCHRLQEVGNEVGADLAALKDRSTDALLTAVLDPNRAVESKFLVYTVATKDGLQYSGMLKGETGGSLTLIGNDGKESTVARADIEELVGSKRSLMPEGLEKDLSGQDLANVIAFVQSTGTAWKRFDGNSPKFVNANPDGSVTLPASAAEIYGPNLIFEEKYGNLGFWQSTEDYAKWTFEVPKSGHWIVEFDFACDNSTAGSLIKFSTGNRMLTARVPGSGSWDNYQTWQAGTIDLHRGRGQLIITAPENPQFALIDLRSIRLIPPK